MKIFFCVFLVFNFSFSLVCQNDRVGYFQYASVFKSTKLMDIENMMNPVPHMYQNSKGRVLIKELIELTRMHQQYVVTSHNPSKDQHIIEEITKRQEEIEKEEKRTNEAIERYRNKTSQILNEAIQFQVKGFAKSNNYQLIFEKSIGIIYSDEKRGMPINVNDSLNAYISENLRINELKERLEEEEEKLKENISGELSYQITNLLRDQEKYIEVNSIKGIPSKVFRAINNWKKLKTERATSWMERKSNKFDMEDVGKEYTSGCLNKRGKSTRQLIVAGNHKSKWLMLYNHGQGRFNNRKLVYFDLDNPNKIWVLFINRYLDNLSDLANYLQELKFVDEEELSKIVYIENGKIDEKKIGHDF